MGPNVKPGFVSGIDVSHHNGSLAWKGIAKSGVLFAFAKATEGSTFTDPQFSANWKGMKGAGVRRGAYHFFHPAKSPEEQADFFLEKVGALQPGDLPHVLDVEETNPADEWGSIEAKERVDLILRWLARVEDQTGVRPILYTRRGWVKTELPDPGQLTEYPLWVAAYKVSKPPLPNGWPKWTFWQYSESGTLKGVNGSFDLDRFNGSEDDLAAIAVPAPPAS